MRRLFGRRREDPTLQHEHLSCRPWKALRMPERILLIRLQAIGDVAITLPAAAALRELLPGARIDMLSGRPAAELAEATSLFDHVYEFPPSTTRAGRIYHAGMMGARLWRHRYDMVLDLQRNYVTRIIRRAVRARSWSEFDRYADVPAGERVLRALRASGIGNVAPRYKLPLRHALVEQARDRLRRSGWDGVTPLICVNPAGLWKTRKWPLERFAELSALLRRETASCVLLLGDRRLEEASRALTGVIPAPLVNLVGQTSLGEAFAMLQHLELMISEDSGLMHMAWASGVPTVALFGSTKHTWSSPQGPHTRLLHSGDLECGDCMLSECVHGDVRCLTRRTPADLHRVIRELQSTPSGRSPREGPMERLS